MNEEGKKKVLLIEDELGISTALRDELEFEGFSVDCFENGLEGLEALLAGSHDLLILDLMLPGKNGYEICREARERKIEIPIIMLTARSEQADKIRGLDLGADDYITKPFHLSEVMARVRAVLRRSQKGSLSAETTEEGSFRIADLRMDTRRHETFRGEERIELTLKEFNILELLFKRAGEVVSRDEILDRVWGEDVYVTHRTVDSHLASLRRKIGDDAENPRYILSLRGIGYKLNENS